MKLRSGQFPRTQSSVSATTVHGRGPSSMIANGNKYPNSHPGWIAGRASDGSGMFWKLTLHSGMALWPLLCSTLLEHMSSIWMVRWFIASAKLVRLRRKRKLTMVIIALKSLRSLPIHMRLRVNRDTFSPREFQTSNYSLPCSKETISWSGAFRTTTKPFERGLNTRT